MNTTESVKYKEAGLHWLGLPPIAWKHRVDQLSVTEKQELTRWLDSVIERAARLRGYVDTRGALGEGDAGHEKSVQESNTLAARIRRALGYTYARQDLRF